MRLKARKSIASEKIGESLERSLKMRGRENGRRREHFCLNILAFICVAFKILCNLAIKVGIWVIKNGEQFIWNRTGYLKCVCVCMFHKGCNSYENIGVISLQNSWELEEESRNICEWVLSTAFHYEVWMACTLTHSLITVKHHTLFLDVERMSPWWLKVVSKGREVSYLYTSVVGHQKKTLWGYIGVQSHYFEDLPLCFQVGSGPRYLDISLSFPVLKSTNQVSHCTSLGTE